MHREEEPLFVIYGKGCLGAQTRQSPGVVQTNRELDQGWMTLELFDMEANVVARGLANTYVKDLDLLR